jgi:histidine triad (HIT) family protein
MTVRFSVEGVRMANSCIFCRIIGGEIPSAKIYEDEGVLAFLDINPISPGHTLVVLKRHVTRLDQCDAADMLCISRPLPKIAAAVIEAVGAPGYNILNNNGRCAGQHVEHLHVHIIPRRAGDGLLGHWPGGTYPPGVMDDLARKISQKLSPA